VRRLTALAFVALCSLAVAACGTTTSTASFKGTEHDVAQTIANLQSDITAGEQKKVCQRDLAAPVVTKLGGETRCESTIKDQISEIDNTELEVESVKVSGATATAQVKSDYGGKKLRKATVSLAQEGGKWKIASLAPPPNAPAASG
jgi:hypothetical protein